jgi:hypothetical protein
MAHSCVYLISEAIIFAAPSTEALEEVAPKSILGKTVAARIPIMIMTTMSSIRVNPPHPLPPGGRVGEGVPHFPSSVAELPRGAGILKTLPSE